MEIRVLLVDSDGAIRSELWNLLSLHRVFKLAGTADTAEQAMDFTEKHEVDVIFTSRQPADARCTSDGNHLCTTLAQSRPDIQTVIYGTAPEQAYSACRAQCAGFLLYPFDPLALQMLVNRLAYVCDLQRIKRETAQRSVMFKTRAGFQLTKFEEMLFVEHINRGNRLVTEDGRSIELLGYTMSALEKLLEPRGFFRCHQSFIVNLAKVAGVRTDSDAKKYELTFRDFDGFICVSREKYTAIVSLLRERFARIED